MIDIKRIFSVIIAVTLIVLAIVFLTGASPEYTDVPETAWYAEDVGRVTSLGLMTGTGATTFSPAAQFTRSEFVAMIGRFANINTGELPAFGTITKTKVNMRSRPNTTSEVLTMLDVNTPVDVLGFADGWYNIRYKEMLGYVRSDLMTAKDTLFKDIGYGTDYGAYVRWAHSSGVLTGLVSDEPDPLFLPGSNILREQICVILYNYSVVADIPIPVINDKVVFSDDNKISAYARTAVYAMQQAGLVGGYSDGRFIPDGSTTRAEAAAIMNRFITAAEEKEIPQTQSQVPSQVPESNQYAGYQLLGNVVEESKEVPNSYFNDACFIGHSMVLGMSSYFSLPRADFFAVNGISTGGILRHQGFPLAGSRSNANGDTENNTGSLRTVLGQKTYGKVYIMLGTNELSSESRHMDAYYTNLCSLVDLVRLRQPSATIYLISILPISQSRSSRSANFNRENVLNYNDIMMQVSINKNVYYIDAFGEFADDKGYLPSSACMSDGVHILSREYSRLKTFLKTHTVQAV